MATSVL